MRGHSAVRNTMTPSRRLLIALCTGLAAWAGSVAEAQKCSDSSLAYARVHGRDTLALELVYHHMPHQVDGIVSFAGDSNVAIYHADLSRFPDSSYLAVEIRTLAADGSVRSVQAARLVLTASTAQYTFGVSPAWHQVVMRAVPGTMPYYPLAVGIEDAVISTLGVGVPERKFHWFVIGTDSLGPEAHVSITRGRAVLSADGTRADFRLGKDGHIDSARYVDDDGTVAVSRVRCTRLERDPKTAAVLKEVRSHPRI